MENNANETVIDIHSLTKGKRILLHLSDLFINFFLAMFFYSMVTFPLGRIMTDYNSMTDAANQNRTEMVQILKDNHLLDGEGTDFTSCLTESSKLFALGFLKGQDDYDYPRTYYIDLLGKSESELKELYQRFDNNQFLDYTDKIVLAEKYVKEFSPLLDEKDTMSVNGTADYETFTTTFFLNVYSEVIKDIQTNTALPSSLLPYQEKNKAIDEIVFSQNWIVSVCGLIAYFISCCLYFLLFPMINRRGRTLTMVAMHVERVGKDNLRILKRKERWIEFVFYFAFHLALSVFLPMMYVDFGSLFSVYGLLSLSIVGLLLDIVSFVVLMISRVNCSLSDILTKTVFIKTDDYDKIAVLKHFHVENNGKEKSLSGK